MQENERKRNQGKRELGDTMPEKDGARGIHLECSGVWLNGGPSRSVEEG